MFLLQYLSLKKKLPTLRHFDEKYNMIDVFYLKKKNTEGVI